MVTATKASESPKARSSSPEQPEGYCRGLDVSAEIIPGAAIMTHSRPSSIVPPVRAHGNASNIPDHPIGPGAIHEGNHTFARQQVLDPGLQEGEPGGVLYQKKELNHTMKQLAHEQKILKNSIIRLQHEKNRQQGLSAYRNHLQLHEHQLTQWSGELEALYTLNEADPELQDFVKQSDHLQDGLAELTLFHNLLVNPDAEGALSYDPYLSQATYSSEDRADKRQSSNCLQDMPSNLLRALEIKKYLHRVSLTQDGTHAYTKNKSEQYHKNNKLKKRQTSLKNQQNELKIALHNCQEHKNQKGLKKWRKKFRNHTRALQVHKQKLIAQAAQLQNAFFVKNWSDHQARDVIAENDKLWNEFAILIQGRDELEILHHESAEQKNPDHNLQQEKNKEYKEDEPGSASAVTEEKQYLPLKSDKEKQLLAQYSKLIDEEERINRWQIDLKFQLYDCGHDKGFEKWTQAFESQKNCLHQYATGVKLWEQQLTAYLDGSRQDTLPSELLNKQAALAKGLEKLVRKSDNLDCGYQTKDGHNHNCQLLPLKKTIEKPEADLQKKYKKLRNKLTSLAQCEANLFKKKVSSKKWRKKFKNYQESLQSYKKEITTWRKQLNNKLLSANGLHNQDIVAKTDKLCITFDALMKKKEALLQKQKLIGAPIVQKVPDHKLEQKENTLLKQDELAQWEQTLIRQQKKLTQWEEALKSQQQTYARQATNLTKKQAQLASWEQTLIKQRKIHLKKEASLKTKKEQLTQWEQRLKKEEQTYTQHKEKPRVPVNRNKELQLNEEHDQLYDEQNHLSKWAKKLWLMPNAKTQYKAYKKRLQAYKKRVGIWEHTLNQFLNNMNSDLALKVLENKKHALQANLKKLINENMKLGQVYKSINNQPLTNIKQQPDSKLAKQYTKFLNQLNSLKQCQANLLKKTVRSEKWQQKCKRHKKSLKDYKRRIGLWENQLQQHLQSKKGDKTLKRLANKKNTLKKELTRLIQNSNRLNTK